MLKLFSKIFERPALEALYTTLTKPNGGKTSFTKPTQICLQDRHETCLAIQMGATAAIHSVRKEFEAEVDVDTAREYIKSLQAGPNITQMLISVKGIHHPLGASSVPKSAKGGSPINIICLYTKTLQGDSI